MVFMFITLQSEDTLVLDASPIAKTAKTQPLVMPAKSTIIIILSRRSAIVALLSLTALNAQPTGNALPVVQMITIPRMVSVLPAITVTITAQPVFLLITVSPAPQNITSITSTTAPSAMTSIKAATPAKNTSTAFPASTTDTISIPKHTSANYVLSASPGASTVKIRQSAPPAQTEPTSTKEHVYPVLKYRAVYPVLLKPALLALKLTISQLELVSTAVFISSIAPPVRNYNAQNAKSTGTCSLTKPVAPVKCCPRSAKSAQTTNVPNVMTSSS